MTETRWRVLLALIVVFTLARIAMTHRVFSQTIDEASHLIAGYDILTKHDFTTDPHHPPLAKVLFALPFVTTPEPVAHGAISRGTILLLRNDRYTQNLARARMPNLLFVAIAKELQALQPVHGWLAISELNIALCRDYSPEVRRWLDELLANRPYRRVGKTIRLYYF
jgi:hypothetical protein